jgi:hypothetical protein
MTPILVGISRDLRRSHCSWGPYQTQDTTELDRSLLEEDRLYVIDRSGRVAYKSKAGPFGFHPDQMAQALAKLVPPASPVKQTH